MDRNKIKKIAICIPTYNREKEFKRLLRSITSQEIIPLGYDFEILIIDNNIVSYLDSVIKGLSDTPFIIHSINVRKKGFSNVRNASISWVLDRDMEALIFLDDDEIVPTDWLNNMIKALEKYDGDIITGPVAQILPPSAPMFVRKFHLLEVNINAISGTKLQYANSNNTLVSRKVLNAMGPSFHPNLNHSGGEDTLFFHQCYLKGFSIYLDNSIMISEPTAPERMTTSYVLKRWFHYGMNKILINQILYPLRWRQLSFKRIARTILNLPIGFASSIIKRDNKRFGDTLCRLSWLAGHIIRFIGISLTNKIYNP